MFAKRYFAKRILALILFALLGLITPIGVHAIGQEYSSQITNSQSLIPRATNLYQTGRFSEAATAWKQAADAFAASGDKLGQAMALSNLCLTYQQLGEWQKAEDAIASSLTLLKNSPSGTQHRKILAQTLNIQGRLQFTLGQTEQALTTWKTAGDTYKQAGDETGAIRITINQAQALQTLGNYNQAWRNLLQNGKNLLAQNDSIVKAAVLRNLGDILRVVGEPSEVDVYWLSLWKDWQKSLEIDEKIDSLEKSQQIFQKSLEIAQRLQINQEIAETQLSLGNTNRALAATKNNASQYYEQIKAARENYDRVISIGAPTTKIQAQLNQLSLLLEAEQWLRESKEGNIVREVISQIQSQLESQIAKWRNIEAEIQQLPASRRSIYARINLAQSLTKAKDKLSATNDQEIVQLLERAVQQAKNIKDARAESYALGTLGSVYEQNRQYNKATDLTRAALNLSQAIKAADISYRWEWQIGRLLKAQENKKDALEYYAESFQTLQSLRSDLVASNPEVQFTFRDSVEPIYRQYVDLLLQKTATEQGEIAQKDLEQARKVIEALQLAELDNFFRDACLTTQEVQIDKVDATAAVLYPIILENRIELILSLPGQPLRQYTTAKNIQQKEVETTLNILQKLLADSRNSQDPDILTYSRQLYDWLIRPAETELKNSRVKTLVFVLDGLLRNIPMAVLNDGNQYLIEKYSIALTPGLQLLKPQRLTEVRLTALAAGLSEARENFEPLPNVESELRLIQAKLPSQELLNHTFTSEAIQTNIEASPFPVVHIATHGNFSSKAEETFILTWDGRVNVKQIDRVLRTGELGRGQPIELLVLSACETAQGDNQAALGLAGVAVRAGARSTLATLWQVSDKSTSILIGQFYKEITDNKDIAKAEALRRAQVYLLKNSEYQLPYYWSPFVLVGNWQ
ncbi:CHAT domain-containing protein [Microseira wollei]|uniref:Tetratricopeptide TPR_4 n=1 Tax=Microseira wollei NIES-4236 TaxID=2530354 RepID=A0AAV3X7L2_9CYAN|nr:CHAT domain-containing protein [Microseira wollei]GET37348.1 tetratricopeptide TPR_4 [Microseira wollei NIES-4236]